MSVNRKLPALIAAVLLCLGLTAAATAVTAHKARASTCTISNDSSAPAEKELSNSTSSTATTASFSPPSGGEDVVVEVSLQYDSNTPAGPAVSVKDSNNTSYTAGPSAYDGSASGEYVFSHYYSSAPGSITVTATRTGAAGAAMYDVSTRVLTGAAASQAGAASMSHHAQTGTSLTSSITPTDSASDIEAAVSYSDTETATASGLTTDSHWTDASDGSSAYHGHVKTGGTSAVTIGWTVASAPFWSLAALEVLPATTCGGGGTAPVVNTTAATSVGTTSATLNGNVNPEGAAATYQFDYGTTASYGSVIPSGGASAGSGTTAVNESAVPAGLTAGTTYHYRIEAANAAGTTLGGDQTFTTSAAGTLTWSPPACGGSDGDTCTTINLSNTGSHQTESLSANTDYKLVLPSSGALTGGLTISGGHNVQIIGGEIDLTYPCSNDASACMGIYLQPNQAGEFYMEGVWIHNPAAVPSSCTGGGQTCSTGDGLDVNNNGSPSFSYNVTLQDDRVDGISGCSGGGDHADVIQPYQAAKTTFDIDHLTGTTNCQGMQIDPDLAAGADAPTYTVKKANVDVTSNPYTGSSDRYGWWLTDGTGCDSGAISLSNVYEQEPDGSLDGNAVWPDTLNGGGNSSCYSSWNGTTKVLSFPTGTSITGTVTEGQPSGGDYVAGGGTSSGTGYVSPGYQ